MKSSNRNFSKVAWEEIYRYIENNAIASKEKEAITKYFNQKIIGYDRDGHLQRAFSL
jgi:hypothetical protein